uniref:Fe2OG dioxygenase domain-containing protein n=1 Tax=Romanomermis culicivorax TaxID=13658 RepID=A0A915HV64_ROMCU
MYSNDKPTDTLFRRAFKRFKNEIHVVDRDKEIIDFRLGTCVKDWDKLRHDKTFYITEADKRQLHINDPSDWLIYRNRNKPGLIVASNIFQESGHYFWGEKCLTDYICNPFRTNFDPKIKFATSDDILENSNLIGRKLRWSILGYDYDWDRKHYAQNRNNKFPENLRRLTTIIAQNLLNNQNYRGESCLVNFYHAKSTLAGHVDHSELVHDQPIIAISFGQPAIFLAGGSTLDEIYPLAIKVYGGDVVIMDGEMRLAYHAVPKILKDEFKLVEEYSTTEHSGEKIRNFVIDFINNHRINLSVRQVNPI